MQYEFLEIIDLVEKRSITNGVKESTLSKAELRDTLAVPDMRPSVLDRTWDFWISRIANWGKVSVEHFDPESNKKQDISSEKMIDRLTDDNLMKSFGKFTVVELDFNKIELRRDYISSQGKKVREWFRVTVDLKPELKKAVNSWL